MSVDSFIQTRLSVDTTSEHSSQPLSHPSLSASSDPVTDPRWQMVLPAGPGAEHAFLKSIASELTESDRQFIPPPTSSASAMYRSLAGTPGPSRALSDVEDQSSSGSRRHSMLRNRLKHGKTNSSIKAPSRSNPNQNPNSNPSLPSGNSSHATTYSGDTRSTPTLSSSLSTKRSAVSSSGHSSSIPPQTHSSQTPPIPQSPSNPQPYTRRANTAGHISVTQQRARTMSLGGGVNGASSSATGSTSSQPQAGILRLATDELQAPSDSEYCVAFVGSKGCGKSQLIRKVIKSYPTLETTVFHSADTLGE